MWDQEQGNKIRRRDKRIKKETSKTTKVNRKAEKLYH